MPDQELRGGAIDEKGIYRMLITNVNQIGLRYDSRGLVFYDEDNSVVLEVEFAKASHAIDAAADCLAVATEMVRTMDEVAP